MFQFIPGNYLAAHVPEDPQKHEAVGPDGPVSPWRGPSNLFS